MKTILATCVLAVFLALPGAVAAQTPAPTGTPTPIHTPTPTVDQVVKEVCASAFGYDSLDQMKEDLLLRAKRAAVNELFGELITASTQVENFAVTRDQIQALSVGFVRVQRTTYDHGPALGDVCVTITAYVTPEDRAKFRPVRVEKRHCVTDPNMTVAQIRTYAQEETLVQALIEYDPRLADVERSVLLRLIRRVEYPESGFVPGTESYCVTVRGEVMPIEVLALVGSPDLAVVVSTPTPTATRTPTPDTSQPLSEPAMTATAAMATVIAYQSRTPTPTPTATPTPNRTATAQAASVQATAIAAQATAQAIAAEEAATATAVVAVARVVATAQAQGIELADVRIGPMDGAVYVYVPPGEFLRGSPEGEGNDNEHPQRRIYLDGFWIKQTEVTNREYGLCVAAGACTEPNNDRWDDARYADYPVTDVAWQQAVDYAAWAGGRLPTEAEWEKACRGDDGRIYPWGNADPGPELLNYGESGVDDTVPVGSYPVGASPYGVLDMAGNVWEWTADWYDENYYARSPDKNPAGPDSGTFRVLRGGAWSSNAYWVRCAYRSRGNPDSRNDSRGFRVVDVGAPPAP